MARMFLAWCFFLFPAGKLYFLVLYYLKDTSIFWDFGNGFWGSGIRHQI